MEDSWKTIKQETIDLGGNNFVEINLKVPPKSEEELIGISKGWYTPDKEKRYKANILISKDKRDELIEILSSIDKK